MSASEGRARSHLHLVSARDDSEEALLTRARAGDAQALELLLAGLVPQVHRWAYGVAGPHADLQDLTQEALIELAVALPTFRGDSSLKTFARRVVVRTVWRSFKKRRRLQLRPLFDAAEPMTVVDPEARAMGSRGLQRLYRCVEKLPEKRRMAFALCGIEGMTPTEAGEALGLPSTVVRARLKHARKELARMLQHDPYLAALMNSSSRGGRDDT